MIPDGCTLFIGGDGLSWCDVLRSFTETTSEPFLLIQEDFFVHMPVIAEAMDHALNQLEVQKAGAVRIYPSPGADADYGDILFGEVWSHSPYRISCQATIWRPDYLRAILSHLSGPASTFEIEGSFLSRSLPDKVLAYKRNVEPWPLEYLCSAIGRGVWSQDAKKVCDREQIEVDWSLRPMATA